MLCDTLDAVQGGAARVEDVVRASLSRIERLNPMLNAFLSIDTERALRRAVDLDQARSRGSDAFPLAGAVLGIKDNLCTVSGATTCGSRLLANFHSLYDAHVVERLEHAGAILIGKTNLDEFAMGSSTENSAFGVTRNPWDFNRVAGGSSGGSAAAVAARLVHAALGSDTGGSIRQPAALCGVTGLKPSYGRVSRYGLVAFGSSLDQVGPITQDARDAAVLLGVIAGHDPRDATCATTAVPDYAAALQGPVSGLRIGIPAEYFGPGLDEQVRGAVLEAVETLKSAGATTTPVSLPHAPYAIACYYILAPAEASSNLARFDGMRFGRRVESADLLESYVSSRGAGLGAEVKRRIMIGTFALSSGYHEAYYDKALRVRTLIRGDFENAFAQVDVIASPVTPTTAFAIGEKAADPLAMYLSDIYTLSANLAGVCAMSIPCGFDARGLPIGLHLTGPAMGEARLMQVAHAYQERSDAHRRVPAGFDPQEGTRCNA